MEARVFLAKECAMGSEQTLFMAILFVTYLVFALYRTP